MVTLRYEPEIAVPEAASVAPARLSVIRTKPRVISLPRLMLNYQTNAGAGVLVRSNRPSPAAIRPGPRDLGRSPGRFRVVGRFRGRPSAAGALRIGRGSGLVRVRPRPCFRRDPGLAAV